MKPINAAIVWQGLSALDNASPIVAIVTGLTGRTKNPKTGPMAQLWILRSDMSPVRAVKLGLDRAICGGCGLRGMTVKINGKLVSGHKRGCYVTVKNAPRAVYRKFAKQGYETRSPEEIALILRRHGLRLRFGAYGDPAALPLFVLENLSSVIVAHTGYTHAWKDHPELARYIMASADSPADVLQAHTLGFRTFRTRAPEQPLLPGEIMCPASEEAGKRTTCDRCSLCNGAGPDDRRASIAIIAHGTPAVHALNFIRKVA